MVPRKNYKADLPNNTIQRIRNILNDADLFVEVTSSFSKFDLHSYHVEICNEDLAPLHIAVGGKGVTKKYAMASAYAEFMEHIQNRRLFIFDHFKYAHKKYMSSNNIDSTFAKLIEERNLGLDYYHSADEKIKLYNDLNVEEHSFIDTLFKRKDFSKIIKDEIIYAPFFHVDSGTVSDLPIKWLYLCNGSNGMCSGNTATEAILHGIAEIFERFSLSRIIKDKIVPPNIPLDFFEGHQIHDLILNIKKKGYKIIIKDCSLGMGLPVIGVIVIDYNTGKYAFHLGADISPITALERCFTELFQGGEKMRFNFIHQFNETGYDIEKSIFSNFYNGSGHTPNHIFSTQYSYEFNPSCFQCSKSDEDDLNYLCKLVSDLGYSLYVRDVSFLGFPAFYVYIQGMSEIITTITTNTVEYTFLFLNKIQIFWNIPNAHKTEIREFVIFLEDFLEKNKFLSTFDFQRYTQNTAYKYPIDFFMSLLFLLCDDYQNAIKYLDRHIHDNIDKLDNLYFACLKDTLKYKSQSLPDEVIKTNLLQIYPVETVEEVLNGLDRDSLLNNNPFTTCFNCSECKIINHCKYFDVLALIKKLQVFESKNPINQEDLKKIFSTS